MSTFGHFKILLLFHIFTIVSNISIVSFFIEFLSVMKHFLIDCILFAVQYLSFAIRLFAIHMIVCLLYFVPL